MFCLSAFPPFIIAYIAPAQPSHHRLTSAIYIADGRHHIITILSQQRRPPLERPDPLGLDVTAVTIVGILRQILFLVILKKWEGSYTHFCRDLGIDFLKDSIQTQCRWYQNHSIWDPVAQSSTGTHLSYSKVRAQTKMSKLLMN